MVLTLPDVGPTLEKLAGRYGSEIHFAKINVDELLTLAERFGIRSILTLLLLREGKVVDRLVGARPYEGLARFLEKRISPLAGR